MFLVVSVKVIAYIVNRAFCIKTPTNRADGTLDPKLPRDTMRCFAVSGRNLCIRVDQCTKAIIRTVLLISLIISSSLLNCIRIVKELFIIKLCSYCIKIISLIRICSKRAIKILDYLIILINRNNV